MEFKLSREQELVRKMVREFTENEIAPIAAETDRTSQYPAKTIDDLFRYGVMGMVVPKEYGGAGADDLSGAIAIEEIFLKKHVHLQAISWQLTTDCAVVLSSLTVPRSRRKNIFPC